MTEIGKRQGDYFIPTRSSRSGPWVIVCTCSDSSSDTEFYTYRLFHVPSWDPKVNKPFLRCTYEDRDSKGIKPDGTLLKFVDEDQVEEQEYDYQGPGGWKRKQVFKLADFIKE
uniref:Uncharacterized protein n=1 Tax=Chromera velia CCMP2878 TaxID=1169474 RepID=A0A0G4FKG4_9ALVE|eukprot:Cvel_408.t1-p1 / transcript=Cvel_408.t1 / gene=Cvel_408 / organism=Chromera_velia_CCMP2878 / gene_product=hypothetical protein / transcript_product=hypothetical protein / location=Cvel_scaffold13:103593-103928(-) / protein_length=112 / sequence_SO=supercontig / SO=protein_coding / is_pseudo=false